MTERADLLDSIALTIADYREGDLTKPTPGHVERWINQFNVEMQVPILREMDHVLNRIYFSRKKTAGFLIGLFQTESLVGDNPCAFWGGVKFLNIQRNGASQQEMLALFSKVLEQKCGFSVDDCGSDPKVFVYLDDAIFSGGTVHQDLIHWIETDAPDNAILYVIVIATHEGFFFNKQKITQELAKSGKTIKIKWWQLVNLENRRTYADTSDVLWPVSIPDDPAVQEYITNNLEYKPHPRNPGKVGTLGIFSSDTGRQVLEQEFLKAGVRIRQMCPNLNQFQRPLGNIVLDSFGFGSLVVTFRNCPNNAPLALWVGDPWYPLFPRTTNSATSVKKLFMSIENGTF